MVILFCIFYKSYYNVDIIVKNLSFLKVLLNDAKGSNLGIKMI